MAMDLESVQSQLQEFKEFRTELTDALNAAREDLSTNGVLPPKRLATRLRDYKKQFDELKVAIFGESALADDKITLADLEKGVDTKQITDRARSVLLRVNSLQHVDGPDFVPLAECHLVCTDLFDEMASIGAKKLPAAILQLADEKHPFCNLLTLIEAPDDLDDETWSRLHESIETSVGNLLLTPTSGPLLATAIARSKIFINSEQVQKVSQTSQPSSTNRVSGKRTAAAKTSEPSETKTSKPGNESPTATDSESTRVASVLNQFKAAPNRPTQAPGSDRSRMTAELNGSANASTGNTSILEPVPRRESQRKWSEASSITINQHSSIHDIAFVAQAARDDRQTGLLQQLVWKLLLEEQYGLAYHVARCLESREKTTQKNFPAWFVRAIALGKEIRFPVGDVSQQLTEDYAKVDPANVFTGNDEWDISARLLLLASSLRASILAPATSGAKLLHLFERREEFNDLNNYVLRVALYGDQGHPLDPNAFKRMQTEAEWQEQQEELSSEIGDWLSQGSRKAITYNSVSHCFLHSHWSMRPSRAIQFPATVLNWKMWQEVLNSIHGLLDPLTSSDFRDVATVKKEVARLGAPSFLDDIQKQFAAGSQVQSLRPTKVGMESIREHLATAIELARRWISLNSSRPNQVGVSVPEREEALRDDIYKRQDASLKELKQFAADHAESLPITAAVACCCRVIEDIRQLFDADTAFPTDQVDIRYLLHAELLKSPNIPLNDKWEPQLDPATFETELLLLLSQPSISWKEAFEERSRHRDHEATARILELDVWENSGEADELRATRANRIQQCRVAVNQGLKETQEMVDEAVKLGLLTEVDFAGLNSQIENIRSTVPTTLHFSHCAKRLIQIRSGIERRRQSEIDRVRHRFQQLRIQSDAQEYHRINEALDGGDLTRANEFMDQVSSNPAGSGSDWVMDFFADDPAT